MIKTSVLVVLLACSSTPRPEQTTRPTNAEPEDAPATNYRAGPGGFPIPRDAESVVIATKGNAVNYQVPRPQAEVVAELRVNLAKLGFRIDKELPNGTIQWMVSKGDEHIYISIPKNNDQTLLILTVKNSGDSAADF